MYKIYFKNIPIRIGKQIKNYVAKNHNFQSRFISQESLKTVIELFKDEPLVDKLIAPEDNIDLYWEKFKSCFKYLEAAGGVINNGSGSYLFIYKNNMWDLPKGKMEKGEIPEQTAIREVWEECGLKNIRIIRQLEPTYHIFCKEKDKILKKTFWFEMIGDELEVTSPLTNEGITQVHWLNREEIKTVVFENTYNSIKDIMLSFKC